MEPMIIAKLVKEYGSTAGRYLGEKINSDENKQKVFLGGISKNESVNSIVQIIFKDKFDSIIQEAKKAKKIRYESPSTEYISLPIDKSLSKNEINDLLKAELSENLERLGDKTSDKVKFMNEASSIVQTWRKKFVELRNPDEQTIKKLEVLHELLKPRKITAKDIFVMLKPLFGLGAVLTLIYTAMLTLGLGMGIFGQISLLFIGIPIGQVIGFLGLAIILASLSLIPVNETLKVQIVINGLYGIIDNSIVPFEKYIEENKEIILIQIDSKNEEKVESSIDIHRFLIKIGIALGRIDNDFVSEEKDKIKSYIDSFENSKELNEYLSFENGINIIEEIKKYIGTKPNKEERIFVYEFLFELASIDGEIKFQEKEILEKLPPLMELDKNIFDNYYSKYQSKDDYENVKIKYNEEIKECLIEYKIDRWDKDDCSGLKGIFDDKLISAILEILKKQLHLDIENSNTIIFYGSKKDYKLLKKRCPKLKIKGELNEQ